jgi:Asp-tRNA(Asn)/Glu-tRNA(Gln) amidotransferase A subunit family amidase
VYEAARDVHLPKLRETFAAWFREHRVEAMVFPTTLAPATPIGQDQEVEIRGRKIAFETAVARNIAPGSTTGLPGLVLPTGLTGSGLPVSLELDGPAGTDRALLALGMAVEPVLGRLLAPSRWAGAVDRARP